jgi:hypothetical protein
LREKPEGSGKGSEPIPVFESIRALGKQVITISSLRIRANPYKIHTIVFGIYSAISRKEAFLKYYS